MSARSTAPVPRTQCAKESGADAGLMGITCYMIRPTAGFMYWHQSTMARTSQMAIRLPQRRSCEDERAAIRGGQRTVVSPQMAPSRLTKAGPSCPLSSAKKRRSSNLAMKGPRMLRHTGPAWADAHHASLLDLWLRTTPRAKFSTDDLQV